MAVTCDHCGKIIGEDDFISFAIDHTENKLGGCAAGDWFYYCEGECVKTVRGLLENLRLYGHEGEEKSGLRWMLVGDGANSEKKAPAPVEETGRGTDDWKIRFGELSEWLPVKAPTAAEHQERADSGIALRDIVAHKASRRKLADSNLVTLEDVADLTEVEFLGVPWSRDQGYGAHHEGDA